MPAVSPFTFAMPLCDLAGNYYRLLTALGNCGEPRDYGGADVLPVSIESGRIAIPSPISSAFHACRQPVHIRHATLRPRRKLLSAADTSRAFWAVAGSYFPFGDIIGYYAPCDMGNHIASGKHLRSHNMRLCQIAGNRPKARTSSVCALRAPLHRSHLRAQKLLSAADMLLILLSPRGSPFVPLLVGWSARITVRFAHLVGTALWDSLSIGFLRAREPRAISF